MAITITRVELQIIERQHEEPKEEAQVVEVKQATPKVKTMSICIPPGTILRERRIPCCVKTFQGKYQKSVMPIVKEKLPTTSHKVEAAIYPI